MHVLYTSLLDGLVQCMVYHARYNTEVREKTKKTRNSNRSSVGSYISLNPIQGCHAKPWAPAVSALVPHTAEYPLHATHFVQHTTDMGLWKGALHDVSE
jgi:hypothetical protein